MNNNGFSAAEELFGNIPGLKASASNDGRTSALAECPDEYGDTDKCDEHSDVIAPTVEYAVTSAIAKTTILVTLGAIVTVKERPVMITQCAITSGANNHPTVTISGAQVEPGATAKRTYPVKIDLLPRSKSQDVAGAFTASKKFTSINTTFSVDPHIKTVKGVPVASDCSHGKIDAVATMTDGDGSGVITLSTTGGFNFSSAPAQGDTDGEYRTINATATKFMAGTEAAATPQ